MPQVRRRSLIPILQALTRLAMKMVGVVAPGLPQHGQRQWVLPRGEDVSCVLVKLTRKLGWNVGHAENMYVPTTAPNKLCAKQCL